MNATLEDILSCDNSPLEAPDAAKKRLLFSPEALSRRLRVPEVLVRLDTKQWRKLSADQLKLVQEAAEDLVSRLRVKEPFKDFKPKDERIIIWSKDRDVGARRRDRPQVFQAYAPGYSRDRQLAIIRVTFPWSMHSGHGTYVMEKRGDKWVVLVRDFVVYL